LKRELQQTAALAVSPEAAAPVAEASAAAVSVPVALPRPLDPAFSEDVRARFRDMQRRLDENERRLQIVQRSQQAPTQKNNEDTSKNSNCEISRPFAASKLFLISGIAGAAGLMGYALHDRYWKKQKTEGEESISQEKQKTTHFWKYMAGSALIAATGFLCYKYLPVSH
jgi:hypothetical protein